MKTYLCVWRAVRFGLLFVFVNFFSSANAQWVAFNDHVAGPGTSNRTTRYLVPGSGVAGASTGPLTNIATGTQLPVTLQIVNQSLSDTVTFGSGGAAPPVGSPAHNTFNNYVDFNPVAATGASPQVPVGAAVIYFFSGLDTNKAYKFTGTHVRGGDTVATPDYTNRFAVYMLSNVAFYAAVPLPGVFSSADSPDIAPGQLVLNPAANAGNQTNGTEAVWDDIVPGASGSLIVRCTRYTGSLPAPFSATNNNPPYSYAITGIRLEEITVTPVAITVLPTNQTVAQCSSVTFHVGATGTAPQYQWYRGSLTNPIPNATGPDYTIARVAPSDAGIYHVRVFNSAASINVTNLLLSVVAEPTFRVVSAVGSTNPTDITISYSGPVDPSSITPNSTFQVQSRDHLSSLAISNATVVNVTNVHLVTAPRAAGIGYEVIYLFPGVTNACSGARFAGTTNIIASQLNLVPIDAVWRYDQSGVDLGTNWINVGYNDSAAPWQTGQGIFDGTTNGPRATVSGQTIHTPLQLFNGASYLPGGSVIPTYLFRTHFFFPWATTNGAILLLRPFIDDAALFYINGRRVATVGFTNAVPGPTTIFTNYGSAYGGRIVGMADFTDGYISLPLTGLVLGDNVLAVELKQVQNNSLDITMGLELTGTFDGVSNVPPAIIIQPQSQAVQCGSPATFAVEAIGPGLTYQWWLSGSPIPGATSSVYVRSNVGLADTGNYSVVVSNSNTGVTSSNALLSIFDTTAPIIICAGNKSVECGTAWSFDPPSASDNCGLVNVSIVGTVTNGLCGATYSATRNWRATDISTNSAMCSQTVTVIDTTPPVITCSSNITVTATNANGKPVSYSTLASDSCSPNPAVVCLPASGTVFPIGTNNVLCQATDACGNMVSCVFSVSVITTAPIIITQPRSVTNVAGSSVSFSVAAVPTGPSLSYQWFYVNLSNPIAGATNATLNLSNIQTTDSGQYRVVVSNTSGSVTSAVAVLTVLSPVVVRANQVTVLSQYTATNSALIDLQTPYTNGHIYFTLDGSDPNSGLLYSGSFSVTQTVTVRAIAYSSNYVQSAEATPVLINIVTAPNIIQQPQGQLVAAGSTAQFSVVAGGTAPLRYQWYFGGSPISSGTNPVLSFVNVQLSNAGTYFVVVSNTYGSVLSGAVNLNVLTAPAVTSQSPGASIALNSPVTLCVTNIGSPPVQYQWRKNGINVSGATNSCFPISSVQLQDGATYTVVMANAVGAVTSGGIQLTVVVPSQSSAATNDNFSARIAITNSSGFVVGTNRVATRETGEPFHAGKQGSNSVWYSWRSPANGIATFGTSGSAFDTLLAVYTGTNVTTLTPVASDDDSGGAFTSEVQFNAASGTDYQVAIDGFAGASGGFILSWQLDSTPHTLPVISVQPTNQTVPLGSNVTFSVTASGTSLKYQWFFNNGSLAGETAAALTRIAVQAANVGAYFVRITNNQGLFVQSDTAVLEIGPVAGVQSKDKFQDLFGTSPPPFSANAFDRLQALAPLATEPIISPDAGSIGAQIFATTNSTTQSFETNHCGVIGGSSRWFQIRPAANGTLIIDTFGSSFDTVLAVYTPANLTGSNLLVACNNNAFPNVTWSKTNFLATNGVYYFIAVDGNNGESGTVYLNWGLGLAPTNLPTTPRSMRAWVGDNVTLRTETNGTPAPTVQWYVNQTRLNGETNVVLGISNIQLGQSGTYSAVLSNFVGMLTNTIAVVQVSNTFLTQVTSTFDRDAEEWGVFGDAYPPMFNSTGGNSGGYVSALDKNTGIYWYWVAPPKFLGNQSAAYGGLLQFDLDQNFTTAQSTDQPDVILTGAGRTLYYFTGANPRTSWTSYKVELDELSDWRIDTPTGRRPTQDEMLRVLASLTDLRIRGEYTTLADTDGLDNVMLLSPGTAVGAILKFRRLGPQQFTIEWPVAVTGFRLQTANALLPSRWVDSTIPPTVVNGINTVTLTSGLFYRLRRP